MIRYFVDLLATLKRIEEHLEKLSNCVGVAHRGNYKPAVRVNPYE